MVWPPWGRALKLVLRLGLDRDGSLLVATRPLVLRSARRAVRVATGHSRPARGDIAHDRVAARAASRTTAHSVCATGRSARALCTRPRLATEHCLGHCSITLLKKKINNHPRDLGSHSMVSEHRYTTTYGLRDMGLGHGYCGEIDTSVTAWYRSLCARVPRTRWEIGLDHSFRCI